MDPRDDDLLMERIAEGDERCFRVLVERWESAVAAFLYRMLGSREEAEDLGQETFLRVYREAGRYRGAGRFRSWLFRIAGNLARSRLRRRRILTWVGIDAGVSGIPAGDEPTDRGVERSETRARVRGALARLPARQRQAVVLREYQEMSYEEIAGTMDTSVSAVESLLHRATTALRRDLSREKDVR